MLDVGPLASGGRSELSYRQGARVKAFISPMVIAVALSQSLLLRGEQRAPDYVCVRVSGSEADSLSPATAQELHYQDTVSGLGPLKAQVLKEVVPDYPTWARSEGIEGVVVVSVTVSTRGRVTRAKATSGPSRLRPVAARAARQWVFRPTGFATGPVQVKFAMTFTFTKTVSPSNAAQLAHAAERAQRDRSVFP